MAGQSFHIRVGEQDHEARVDDLPSPDAGDARRVTVDGEVFEVQSAPGGSIVVRCANGVHVCVTLDGQPSPKSAHVPGHSVDIDVQTAQAAALAAARRIGGAGAAAAGQVNSPMPGRVVRILVDEGQSVAKGTPVIIIEAMKMENEMHAAAAGVVERIVVAEGDTVDAGQLLCEIKLDDAAL